MANHNELNYERGYQAGSLLKYEQTKKVKEDLKHYLDTNEENGVVYIPKFMVQKMIELLM